MMKKFFFSIITVFLLLSVSGVAQTKEPVKARASWTSSSMRVVSPHSSKSELIPNVDRNDEMRDGRYSKINPIIGKGSEGDDILVKQKSKLEQKIPGSDPELVFDSVSSNSQPTDPSIGVGPNHVITVFNTGYRIFDKSGTALTGPLSPDNLFSTGSCCDLTVSYDNAADRWMLSILYSSDGHVEVAVSQGPDPVNDSWSVYSFDDIEDYQKVSVWSDGYYMTANVNSTTADVNDAVFALDRTAMLAGAPTATIVAFPLPGIETAGFYSPQAFNVSNDDLPALGNAPIVFLQDDAFNGINQDHLKIWTINVDFTTPANSTISQPLELNTTNFVSVFDGGAFDNLQQPNGGSLIDALQSTIMNQAQFRKFDTHNSAVFTFVVDVDGSANKLAGIRWYELRQSGDGQPWSIFQEGTYTSPDEKHAWNGSMMMDDEGNIALGYTGMGGTTNTFVSSYYTGRFTNDTSGIMSIDETLIAAGTGNIPGTRYGDYGKMDIDPSNDQQFWFINEYINTNRSNVVGVFQLIPDTAIDGGVTSINLPSSGLFNTNEDITVSIANFGSDPISNFDVTYQINGGTLITETFTGTIPSVSSVDFTFSQTADLSNEGEVFNIIASTQVPNDEDTSNDTTNENFTSLSRNDIGISAITSPISGEGLGSESITVTVENFGGEAQSNFDITYIINGGTPVVENFSGSIDPEESISFTFTTPANLSVLGSYEIISTTSLSNDNNSNNDSFSINVINFDCLSESNTTADTIGPDAGTITTSVINFTENFIVSDVNVTVNLEHTWDSDLILTLIAPDGTEVELSSGNGGSADNYTNTVFDNEATTPITNGSAPFTGSFIPEESLTSLNGISSAGDWTLSILDTFDADGGQLLDWSIQLCRNLGTLSVGDNFDDGSEFLILDQGNNQFDISLTNTEITALLTLNVYNLVGQRLLDYRLQNNNGSYNYQLDMSYAPQGVYIITLGNGSRVATGKIIKR